MRRQLVDSEQKFLISSGIALLTAVLGWITIIPRLGPIITIISGACLAAIDLVLMIILVERHLQDRRGNDDLYIGRFWHYP